MIDVSQWRAAIGHWNSSRLGSLTPATGINAESLRESTNETFEVASTIKPADIPTVNITADFTAAFTHITAIYSASTGSDFTPNLTSEASTKETIPIYKGMLSFHIVLYAVYLILYFTLLLLSGDVELNPGPVTVEQICTRINKSLQEHFASIEEATKHCILNISSELYSKDLISGAVNDSPTYRKIYDEFKAGLSSVADLLQLIERYETFLKCLSCDGGPAKGAVDSLLITDWKGINKHCEEELQTFSFPETSESEEEIKLAVSSLNKSFAELLGKLKEELKDANVSCIVERLEDYGLDLQFEELKTARNVNELISKLNKYYDFLDCDVLETIATEFTTPTLSQKFQDHSKAALTFRKSKSVTDLRKFLQEIFSPHVHNLADAPKAHIHLQDPWTKLPLQNLYTLIKRFFPTCDPLALTKAINITCSSVHITYFMTESPKEIEDLILHNRKKLAFMKYIGVYELCINGVAIFQNNRDKSFDFGTAFLEAAQARQTEVIEFILRIESCSDGIIKILISKYPNSLCKKVFVLAAQRGFIEIVLKFLQKKLNPNIQKNGWTALMAASQNGHQEVVELLLNEKADSKFQNNDGKTALMLATQNNHQKVVELLLNEKADPNIQDNDGMTALMAASQNGHQQVVKLLLNKKADYEIQSDDGRTALMLATQNNHQHVVKLLLNKKADPNIQDNDGWTVLMAASQNDHQQVVELLLNEKADPNIQDNDGMTALMAASQNGHQQVVELLLKEKADPNIQDNDGATALMAASQNGHHQVVELLLKKKADPNIQHNDSWTALMAASQDGHQQVVELLLKKNADPNIQHNDGWTALMIARQNGHQQVVELLSTTKSRSSDKKIEGQMKQKKATLHIRSLQFGLLVFELLRNPLSSSKKQKKNMS